MADINPSYPVRELTQAQYDALTEKDSGMLYCITDTPKYQASGDRFLETRLMRLKVYEALTVLENDVLYCIQSGYDEEKISLVLLDENLESTGTVDYVETIDAVKTYLGSHTGNHYLVHFGDDCGISSIPANSMQSLSNMVKLYVGTSVTEIGTAAFRYCSNLQEAVIHCGRNANIGNNYMSPFDSCTSLKALYLSGGEGSTVGYHYGLNALETVEIGPGIVSVISFNNCKSLQNIVLGNDLITIKGSAFMKDSALQSITIPSNVETIGSYAFYQCDSLTSITINKAQGSISGAPWGAANTTVIWTG